MFVYSKVPPGRDDSRGGPQQRRYCKTRIIYNNTLSCIGAVRRLGAGDVFIRRERNSSEKHLSLVQKREENTTKTLFAEARASIIPGDLVFSADTIFLIFGRVSREASGIKSVSPRKK